MTWWALICADWLRTPVRLLLTVLSLLLAFLLFGLLQPVRTLFSEGITMDGDRRLVVAPKHSVADMLPVKYKAQIEQHSGVTAVAHMTWFGGTYQDPSQFFPQFAVPPAEFLQVNPEIQLVAQQAQAFVDDRRGAIVGRTTAARFGWQIGDTVSLAPTIWHNHDGTAWQFEIVGIFASANESLLGNDGFYFGFPYFDQYRAFAKGTVGTFVAEVDQTDQLEYTAKWIDGQFANSSAETRTQNGAEYALSFSRQLGDIGSVATVILIAVFFTMLMLTSHAMSRTVHERTAEIATMRVLGFNTRYLAYFLLVEQVAVFVGAAALGLGLADFLARQLAVWIPETKQLGGLAVSHEVVLQGLLIAVLLGLAVTALPVCRAVWRPLTDALRVEV